MGFQAGYINSSGRPAIKIWVFGAYIQLLAEFEAVIDTGFTGFLSMPLVKAFPLGLPLIGTTLVALADGKTHSKFIANSSVSITGDVNDSNAWKTGIVILEPSSTDILLGMEFFRTFGKTLVVYASRQQVRLIDDVEIANP